jgi:hypothetical protein
MYSQAGQDAFILSLIPVGTYLEIGASHPMNINNTFALERAGWKGWSFDIEDISQAEWLRTRAQPLIIADAVTYDYSFLPPVVDYLQIDIDPAPQSLACLKHILTFPTRYKIITFEHDYYYDKHVRDESRELLTKAGYQLAKADVEYEGKPFEDWWITATDLNSI